MLSTETIFCTPVVAVGLAAAVHATAYIHGEARRHLPRFWFFFVSTVAAMVAVVFADGKLPFLLAWEAMGLASAGLVAFESKEKSVRKATWIYLLACHAGACALMLAGVLMDRPETAIAALAGSIPDQRWKNLRKPQNPSGIIAPDIMADAGAGAAGCASGSQE